MDTVALAAFLFAQLPGEVAEPIGDKVLGWSPARGKCHENAASWVLLHPADRMLPGWVHTPGVTFENRVRFASHTVVETGDGRLLDVTLGASDAGYRFIRHPGAHDEFYAAVSNNGLPTIDHLLGPDPEFDYGAPPANPWENPSGHL